MIAQKLSYEELIQFIADNFNSYDEFNSTLSKYNGNIRLTSLPELDWVFKNNLPQLNTISGEINSGKLLLFGEQLSEDDLKFWISKNYPTKDALESLIDLYTGGGQVEDVADNILIKSNLDNIINLFYELYPEENELNVEEQIEDNQAITKTVADINQERYDSFSVELFNEDEIPIMRKYKSFSDIPTQSEYLDVLQATLQQGAFNFKEMHWSVKGPGFKGIHELLGECYDKFEKYLDELIETRFSNNDAFDYHIESFVFNSIISDYNDGCPIEGSLAVINPLLELAVSNQDTLYADMIGRLTTDLNHYKFMFNGYKEALDNETLTDETIITDPTYVVETKDDMLIPTREVIQETIENSVPEELVQIKSFCTTKRQARCFNALVKSFNDELNPINMVLGILKSKVGNEVIRTGQAVRYLSAYKYTGKPDKNTLKVIDQVLDELTNIKSKDHGISKSIELLEGINRDTFAKETWVVKYEDEDGENQAKFDSSKKAQDWIDACEAKVASGEKFRLIDGPTKI